MRKLTFGMNLSLDGYIAAPAVQVARDQSRGRPDIAAVTAELS
jgi:hypothetical protein